MKSRLTLFVFFMISAFAATSFAIELKDITYSTKDAGKVTFSHKVHLNKKSRTAAAFSCKSCHEKGLVKTRSFTMAEMEKGKSCGACHNGKKAFPLKSCERCHRVKEITYKVKETGPVVFSHSTHLRTMECNACHSAIFKTGPNPRATMADMEKGKSCGACHDGKKGFKLADCARCHPTKEVTYKVADAGDVLFSHKFHTDAYTCSDCHPTLYIPGKGNKTVTMTEMESQKSCGACHDGSTAFTVKENCEKCHQMQ